MKKGVLLAAVAATFAGAAHAQSSVTLYGVVDDGLSYISNAGGHSNFKMDSGVIYSDRWGLTGKEDIGNGLQAVFTLENGFDVNSGAAAQGGALFGRRAFVGLSSNRLGTLILGNDYDFIYDYVTFYSNTGQFGGVYSFHLGYDIDRLAGEQVHNMVRYETPTVGGFNAGVMYGFSNVAGGFGGTSTVPRAMSVGLKYSPTGTFNALYSFGAAFTKLDGGNAAPGAGSIAQVALGAKSIYTAALGALVKFGNFSVNGVYTYTNASDTPQGTVTVNAYEGGLSWRPAPDILAGAGFAYIDERKRGKYDIATLGFDYLLSKRTDVFAVGTFQHALGGAHVAGNFYAVTPYSQSPTLPNGAGASSTANQAVAQIGIRHKF
ncbi:porin [Caballeronia sp. ATUFL_M2_KS44]|uniref:porin n=1 Tax=Caballeronia sp. ATUFL_M2_KS44 TaxID=2921767 RepID=UPI002028E651|nr:porin [Caballeronia sp. ATUFL_M2_KS44]